MQNTELSELAAAIEAAGEVSPEQAGRAIEAITAALPEERRAMLAPEAFLSSDAMLLIVDRVLPGWAIRIEGVASEQDGHWSCTLRNSGGRDNDPFVGIGKCRRLPLALLAALLKALAFAPAT